VQERQLEVAEGSLYYEVTEEKGKIVRYQGQALQVEVPALIEGYPVTGVGKKAFLSRKNLRKITLPDTVKEIGDWAFAYCDGLMSVSLPGRRIQFGKAVFLECEALKRIEIRGDRGEGREFQNKDIPELLAAAVRVMDAYYLLDLSEVGSDEWLAKWDARLRAILHAPDQEGYSKQVLCGEEDYGNTDFGAFVSNRRKGKVRLAYLRLLRSQGLQPLLKKELEEYLRGLTKGQDGEEAWLVILEEHGNDREYYELFAELGCVNEGNYEGILSDIGEGYPEMKAFFLRLCEGWRNTENFLDGFEL